jgi:glyoxylase-like metal-dependent hydrolase (beta-lactamase superfamily II)
MIGRPVTRFPLELGEGVWQFQTPLWQTNSVLAFGPDEALVCDPAFTPAEIESIRAEAEQRVKGPLYVLITHADFDHVCGIPYFPDAEVISGEGAARRIESGTAADEMRDGGFEWGADWPTDELRITRVVGADKEFACGAFRLAAIDAPSHGREGLAYALLEQGVLLPGDHLSAVTYPLLAGSLQRATQACRRLVEALGQYDVRWVVPGHGPALTRDEAKKIGEEDLSYLEKLEAAAREALDSALPPGYALLHVYDVEPPRPNTPDFEIYGIRAGNARQALADVEEHTRAEV